MAANFSPLAPLPPPPRFLQAELIPATVGFGPGAGVITYTGQQVGVMLDQGVNVGAGAQTFVGAPVELFTGLLGFSVGAGALTVFGATISLGAQGGVTPTTGTAFAPALSELGLDAWERCGKQAGEITTTMVVSMRRSMNFVLSRWSNRGVDLWTVASATIELQPGVATYTLPVSLIDMLDTYVRTTIGASVTDLTLTSMSRETYARLPQKSQPGRPIMFWYDRTLTPSVTLWPVPDAASTYSLVYYAFSQTADADPTNGMLFGSSMPFRFVEAYTAALAANLAIKWAPERAVILDGYAKEVWDEAAAEDREKTTTTVSPDWSGFYS